MAFINADEKTIPVTSSCELCHYGAEGGVVYNFVINGYSLRLCHHCACQIGKAYRPTQTFVRIAKVFNLIEVVLS